MTEPIEQAPRPDHSWRDRYKPVEIQNPTKRPIAVGVVGEPPFTPTGGPHRIAVGAVRLCQSCGEFWPCNGYTAYRGAIGADDLDGTQRRLSESKANDFWSRAQYGLGPIDWSGT